MSPRGPQAGWFRRHGWVVLSMGAIVALAVFLRTAFNLQIFISEGLEFAGNDPYYHLRAIRTIVETGHHFLQDPLLDYPSGFKNVNPPTFNWTVAIVAAGLMPFFGSTTEAIMWVQSASPVLWGALTVVVVYFITAEVFDRRSGVIAALLMAIMASHIERSMFAFADHDSFVLFFISLGMLFYLKALGAVKRTRWVDDWGESRSVASGIKRFVDEARLGLVYAALAGLAIANVALAWKGFHYGLAILFGYGVFQLVFDQIRGEESLDVFVYTVVAMAVVIVLAAPFYAWADMYRWFEPSLYILAGFAVVGVGLVPTRDMPALLVLPSFVAFIVGSLAIIAVAFPELSQVAFAGIDYFQQSAVYQTIAEAHPPDFSTLVFNFGVATFYMALAGVVLLVLRIRKDLTLGKLFLLAWSVIAIYMAVTAMRFIFNASPVFAIMAGWVTWFIVDRLDYRSMLKRLRGYGDSVRHGLRRAVNIGHIAGILFIALAIVVPNTYFALDAGMPTEYESQLGEGDPGMQEFVRSSLGAFGQNYLPGYWEDGLEWLATQDTDVPAEDRPGFISWWDYGFWTTALGDHPTVADNFQNNFFFAGRFLGAQNGTHAVQVLVAGFWDEGVVSDDQLRGYLRDAGVDEGNVSEAMATLDRFRYTPHLSHDQTIDVYRRVTDSSGKIVRYAAVDQRLFPFDDPRTPGVDFNSIFYAPIRLAELGPDNYVSTVFSAQVQGPGGSTREIQVTEAELQQLRAAGRQVQVTGQSLRYKQPFFDSMVYRIYIGTPPRGQAPGSGQLLPGTVQPCFGMQNFRVVYRNNGLRVCKFYFGAKLNGTVRTTAGDPMARTTVAVLDAEGIPHHQTLTGPNGTFTLDAPFGDATVVAFAGRGRNQVVLGQADPVDVSDDAAMSGARVGPADIAVRPANVTGLVFWDRDGDGAYDPANDTRLSDAVVVFGQQVAPVGEDGTYRLDGVQPGRTFVRASKQGYSAQPEQIVLEPNATTTHNVSMTITPVQVSGHTFEDADGDGAFREAEAVGDLTVRFEPTDAADNTAEALAVTSNATGGFEASLNPGNYTYSVNGTADGVRYTATGRLDLPLGGEPVTLDVAVREQ